MSQKSETSKNNSDTITEKMMSANVDGASSSGNNELVKTKSESTEPYCVFSKSKKLFICSIVSYAGLVSPFSGTIYFPALTLISEVILIRIRTIKTFNFLRLCVCVCVYVCTCIGRGGGGNVALTCFIKRIRN